MTAHLLGMAREVLVADRVVGAYQISIWTDPDATDDGSAAGKFWARIARQMPSPSVNAMNTPITVSGGSVV